METEALYRLAADAVLIVHAFFVLFVVGGQALILVGWARGWRWPRQLAFRVAHLVAIGFVVLETWFGVVCPLTVIENKLRILGGEYGYPRSFIGYWLQRLLFYSAPEGVFVALYTAFALLVLASFIGYPPRVKPRV